jgi:flagellar export protein FliJ
MAKEKYRLQALLTIKQREKKRAEMALAIAIREFNDAKKREKELIEEKEKIVKEWHEAKKNMSAEMAAGSLIFDGNTHTNFLRKLKDDEEEKEKEIEEHKEVVKEAKEAVAGARRDYIDASKELQVMEKHKELWAKKIQKEISKKEEKELNDLGNTIHQLKKWRGEEAGI